MIKPKRLSYGDTVAIVRPASRLKTDAFENSVRNLRSLGFCVAEYPRAREADKFFAASDSDRAAELSWAMSEPGIRAVLIARGGYGCQRTLAKISDRDLRSWSPRILVGYSDPTYLHQWIQNKLGWISFHGPLTGVLPAKTMKGLMNDLVNLPTRASSQTWSEISNLGSKSKARGKLVGGNLSLIQVAGAASLPKEPIILAIEEVNENHYRIDRMLRTLIDAGYQKYVKAMILGTFTGCGKDDAKIFRFTRILETLRDLTSGPIWTKARFGHGFNHSKVRQRVLPLGCEIELHQKEFRILEPVVR